nr:hypothetical protein [Polyangiaceae bacterium]
MINRGMDPVALLLDQDPPADVQPMKVLLHKDFANTKSTQFGVFEGIETWASSNDKNLTILGMGTGTNVYPVADYGNGFAKGRMIGMTQWSGGTTYGFSPIWTSCNTRNDNPDQPAIIGLAPDWPEDGSNILPGTNTDRQQAPAGYQNASSNYSIGGGGDSGGPVVVGGGITVKTLNSSPLPWPRAATDKYEQNERFVAGLFEWNMSRNGLAGDVFAPLYRRETSQWLSGVLTDTDEDGYPDVVDNCPDLVNASQLDADSDGLGDACDPCPCDGAGAGALRDSDGVCDYCQVGLPGDAVGNLCAAYCNAHPVDNCVGVNNLDQANCNADAERKANARIMGDACDPVPCPAFLPRLTEGEILSTSPFSYIPNGGYSATQTIQVYNHQLSLNLLGSRGAPDLPDVARRGINEVVPNGSIKYRYCTNLSFPLTECDRDIWVGMDGVIDDPETINSGWHRVKMAHLSTINDFDNGTRTYGGSTGQSQLDVTWQWASDFQRWANTWPNSFPASIPSAPGQGRGRFWTHFATAIGTTDTSLLTGVHGQASNPSLPALPILANHFESFAPVEQRTRSLTHKSPVYQLPAYVMPCHTVGCPPDLGIPSLDDCPMCSFKPDDAFSIYDSMPFGIYNASVAQPYGALVADGSYVPLKDNFSPSLQARFTQGLTWVGAAEPSPNVGASASYPQMLALSADGRQVVERVTMLRQGMFTTASDRSERPLPASTNLPTARSAFVPVYA